MSLPQFSLYFGAIAQMGERLLCTQQVRGSNPRRSTTKEQSGNKPGLHTPVFYLLRVDCNRGDRHAVFTGGAGFVCAPCRAVWEREGAVCVCHRLHYVGQRYDHRNLLLLLVDDRSVALKGRSSLRPTSSYQRKGGEASTPPAPRFQTLFGPRSRLMTVFGPRLRL